MAGSMWYATICQYLYYYQTKIASYYLGCDFCLVLGEFCSFIEAF